LNALPYVIAGLRERGFTFDIMRNFPMTQAEKAAYLEHYISERRARITQIRNQQLRFMLTAESLR
jgi:hypothetical protein